MENIKIFMCSAQAISAIQENGMCYIQGFGDSMEPLLHSGDVFRFSFVTDATNLYENSIVFCKMNGQLMLHKIVSIDGDRIEIGNNKGKIHGWISRRTIYGIYEETLDRSQWIGTESIGKGKKETGERI